MICPNCSGKLTENMYCENCKTKVNAELFTTDILGSVADVSNETPPDSTVSEAEDVFATIPIPTPPTQEEVVEDIADTTAPTKPEDKDLSAETTVFDPAEVLTTSEPDGASEDVTDPKEDTGVSENSKNPVKRSIKITRRSKKILITVVTTLVVLSIAAGGVLGYLSAKGKLKFSHDGSEAEFHWSDPQNAKQTTVKTPKDLGEKLK